jgi:hypothetical protein
MTPGKEIMKVLETNHGEARSGKGLFTGLCGGLAGLQNNNNINWEYYLTFIFLGSY